jgi:hypothetical protein
MKVKTHLVVPGVGNRQTPEQGAKHLARREQSAGQFLYELCASALSPGWGPAWRLLSTEEQQWWDEEGQWLLTKVQDQPQHGCETD